MFYMEHTNEVVKQKNNRLISIFYIDHTNQTYSLPIKVHLKPREENQTYGHICRRVIMF